MQGKVAKQLWTSSKSPKQYRSISNHAAITRGGGPNPTARTVAYMFTSSQRIQPQDCLMQPALLSTEQHQPDDPAEAGNWLSFMKALPGWQLFKTGASRAPIRLGRSLAMAWAGQQPPTRSDPHPVSALSILTHASENCQDTVTRPSSDLEHPTAFLCPLGSSIRHNSPAQDLAWKP